MGNGTLVSIEGIDGAGKTSVVQGTEEVLGISEHFEDSVVTTEPDDDTWIGQVVREAISSEGPSMPPMSIFFLFLTEHANHVENVVRPELAKGNLVICDRYIDSRYVYQSDEIESMVEGDALNWIRNIQEQKWTEIPDLTLVLDLPVEDALDRLDGDEIFEKEEKLRSYRETYLDLAEQDSRYAVVDATQSPQSVVEDCRDHINSVR